LDGNIKSRIALQNFPGNLVSSFSSKKFDKKNKISDACADLNWMTISEGDRDRNLKKKKGKS
jgi:hypothetical protein